MEAEILSPDIREDLLRKLHLAGFEEDRVKIVLKKYGVTLLQFNKWKNDFRYVFTRGVLKGDDSYKTDLKRGMIKNVFSVYNPKTQEVVELPLYTYDKFLTKLRELELL